MDETDFERRLGTLLRQPAEEDGAEAAARQVGRRLRRRRAMRRIALAAAASGGALIAGAAVFATRPYALAGPAFEAAAEWALRAPQPLILVAAALLLAAVAGAQALQNS